MRTSRRTIIAFVLGALPLAPAFEFDGTPVNAPVKQTAPLVKYACRETVKRPGIAYGDRMVGTAAIRGVCPEYGEMRNEVPREGRWLTAADDVERRRVIFDEVQLEAVAEQLGLGLLDGEIERLHRGSCCA